ncbi:MAG: DNA mismatch repair endonuclease MutL, partial [Deltaproteobacteria bacterium]|nr:DNA mismatch repair endonuclease MutL [Deltaproteobacteria bacterium]
MIRRLPDHLINLIAAGEVVERPASVLKELVENAIDAGARRVDVRLGEGGTDLIEIIDDGEGMTGEDLILCIERHATSKIVDADCLEAIETFGFRGEALSSIAAVGHLTIQSRRRGESLGHKIAVEFGEVKGAAQPVGQKEGTTITVTRLFEKLPARQKFLRSHSTELAHCQKILKEIALGNPSVSFFVSHNGGTPKSYVSDSRADRVRECLKVDWEPLCLKESTEGIELEGFLSPAHTINDRGELFVYVNGRSVRNRNLMSAVRSAYIDTLGPHHDPSGALFIDIRADWVDVNVHPQKSEVRILKGEILYSWIVASIRKHLSQPPKKITEALPKTWLARRSSAGGNEEESSPLLSEIPMSSPEPDLFAPPVLEAVHQYVSEAENLVVPGVSGPRSAMYQPVPVIEPSSVRYLGQADAAYLVCEDDEGLLLVDQHALHEKFRFEELMASAAVGRQPTQSLLVPKVISLPPDLTAIAEVAL